MRAPDAVGRRSATARLFPRGAPALCFELRWSCSGDWECLLRLPTVSARKIRFSQTEGMPNENRLGSRKTLSLDGSGWSGCNNEAGAPGPLKRVNRFRLYDALIPMRGVDLNPYCKKECEGINWEARRRQVTSSFSLSSWEALAGGRLRKTHDETSVCYDLWRFSCEMPDAPSMQQFDAAVKTGGRVRVST